MLFEPDDFKMSLKKTLTPPNHIWAASGSTVCAPQEGTVTGVKGCFSPPIAAPDTRFGLVFSVDGHPVPDNASRGKGDCGLLYAGGDWLPDKIIRRGTYHYEVGGKLLSLGVVSELVPLFGTSGFAVSVTVENRMAERADVSVTPQLTPGEPVIVPLSAWEFTPPTVGQAVKVTLLQEAPAALIEQGGRRTFYFAVIFTGQGEKAPSCGINELTAPTRRRWNRLLKLASQGLPKLESDIPGLQAYYERSLLSGLVCLWENDEFIANPFPAASGIDGGSMCCYPWDVAGYSARGLVMLLGDKALDFFKALLRAGIDKHISMAPDGSGLGWCPYSYSCWSLVNLYSEILRYCDRGGEFFEETVRIFEKEEARLPEWEHLKDYGRQHNLLEMRTCGYEYLVVSPNAERAWCYDRLADIGAALGKDMNSWHEKAALIRRSIVTNLWDEAVGWFKCLHPDNHVEIVYSIQIFDALKTGVCTSEMKKAILSHLREGAFLGKYGVSSVSAEDRLHYEQNDPDWSGGGAYSGDGPELAETLYQCGEAALAWEVLSRHFWMGEHLLYYPQEHFCDIPGVPAHKRANIIAGIAGVHAILYGMAGIKPMFNGGVEISPSVPADGAVKITGFSFRDKRIDLLMKPEYIKVSVNGEIIYEGEPKTVLVPGGCDEI